MKASKKAHSGFLFISGSSYRRIPVFRYRKPCHILLQTLEAYRRKYGLRIYAYAVMLDHYHFLLWFPPDRQLVDFLRDFKSFAGRRILDWLRQQKQVRFLSRFELNRKPRQERDARYCVLQYNSYVKAIANASILRQKVNYIHTNPVREGLATTPEGYEFSSARAYAGKGLSWVKLDRIELPYD